MYVFFNFATAKKMPDDKTIEKSNSEQSEDAIQAANGLLGKLNISV